MSEPAADLASALLGTWTLESWTTTDGLGTRHPFGVAPTGLLVYAPDGGMAALVASGERPSLPGASPARRASRRPRGGVPHVLHLRRPLAGRGRCRGPPRRGRTQSRDAGDRAAPHGDPRRAGPRPARVRDVGRRDASARPSVASRLTVFSVQGRVGSSLTCSPPCVAAARDERGTTAARWASDFDYCSMTPASASVLRDEELAAACRAAVPADEVDRALGRGRGHSNDGQGSGAALGCERGGSTPPQPPGAQERVDHPASAPLLRAAAGVRRGRVGARHPGDRLGQLLLPRGRRARAPELHADGRLQP